VGSNPTLSANLDKKKPPYLNVQRFVEGEQY